MSRVFQVIVKEASIAFDSPYTDDDAIARLTKLFKESKVTSGFASSLVMAGSRSKLSEKQIAWVHKLVVDYDRTVFMNIVHLFDQASKHLTSPRMVFDLPEALVVLSRNTKSKYPDSIQVECATSEARGWIDTNGIYYACKGSKIDQTVMRILRSINTDPIGFSSGYGILTGRCCFCHTPLNKQESLQVGYGPVCAKHYGLPWGKKATKTNSS